VAGCGMPEGVPHHKAEKQSTSRLLELFSTFRDILYGDANLLRVSETCSDEIVGGISENLTELRTQLLIMMKVFDSFLTPGLSSHNQNLDDSEQMETKTGLSVGQLQLKQIYMEKEWYLIQKSQC